MKSEKGQNIGGMQWPRSMTAVSKPKDGLVAIKLISEHDNRWHWCSLQLMKINELVQFRAASTQHDNIATDSPERFKLCASHTGKSIKKQSLASGQLIIIN